MYQITGIVTLNSFFHYTPWFSRYLVIPEDLICLWSATPTGHLAKGTGHLAKPTGQFSQAYRTQHQPKLQDTAKCTGQISQAYMTNQPNLQDTAKQTGKNSQPYRTRQPVVQDK